FPDCTTSYLVMELVEGQHLDVWSGGLGPGDAAVARRLRLAVTLATPLSHPHNCRYVDQGGIQARGLMHRDLQPSNAIVRPADSPVILDFLLAHIHRLLDPRVVPAHLLRSAIDCVPSTAMGTPGFMAPEQERDGIVTEQTDVFGLGMTLLHVFVTNRLRDK